MSHKDSPDCQREGWHFRCDGDERLGPIDALKVLTAEVARDLWPPKPEREAVEPAAEAGAEEEREWDSEDSNRYQAVREAAEVEQEIEL